MRLSSTPLIVTKVDMFNCFIVCLFHFWKHWCLDPELDLCLPIFIRQSAIANAVLNSGIFIRYQPTDKDLAIWNSAWRLYQGLKSNSLRGPYGFSSISIMSKETSQLTICCYTLKVSHCIMFSDTLWFYHETYVK